MKMNDNLSFVSQSVCMCTSVEMTGILLHTTPILAGSILFIGAGSSSCWKREAPADCVGADEIAACVSSIISCTVAEREDVAPREFDDVPGCVEGCKREVPPDSVDAGKTAAYGSAIISSAAPERDELC